MTQTAAAAGEGAGEGGRIGGGRGGGARAVNGLGVHGTTAETVEHLKWHEKLANAAGKHSLRREGTGKIAGTGEAGNVPKSC